MEVTRFGIVLDHSKPQAEEAALRVGDQLRVLGAQVAFDEEVPSAQLVLVFGGDGLVMHTALRLAGKEAAVLGVNYGRLGFLTEVEPDEVEKALQACLAGEFRVEARMLLEGTLSRKGKEVLSGIAVNDVALRGLYKAIDFAVYLDGSPTKAEGMRGDGVIVASPTGSTAYSFSAGGPIVAPEVSCLLLTLISPRFPSRSMILSATTTISIELTGPADAAVNLDGQQVTAVRTGDVLNVKKADLVARFASLREYPFLHRLQTRLNEGQF